MKVPKPELKYIKACIVWLLVHGISRFTVIQKRHTFCTQKANGISENTHVRLIITQTRITKKITTCKSHMNYLNSHLSMKKYFSRVIYASERVQIDHLSEYNYSLRTHGANKITIYHHFFLRQQHSLSKWKSSNGFLCRRRILKIWHLSFYRNQKHFLTCAIEKNYKLNKV